MPQVSSSSRGSSVYRITLGLLVLELIASFPGAHDRATWWLEVAPVLLALPFIWHFARKGALSPFLQAFIVLHGLILCVGGHYTYALAPPGDWVRDLGLGTRNNYDKLGHFMQGFLPALVLREIFLRLGFWKARPVLMAVVTVLVCGGVSAFYEVLEMTAALILGGGADAFLGTQGYVWDTQTDMATALGAALAALFFLPATHAKSVSG